MVSPVHPRTSGEQNDMKLKKRKIDGSSPHERGTVAEMRADIEATRFIPARAGNRMSSGCTCAAQAVHPRTSGEQAVRLRVVVVSRGSSPHERGTG